MFSALQGKRMHLATMWLGIAGLGLMALLMAKRVKGAIMIGILFTTFISWIPGHGASYLGAGSQVPGELGPAPSLLFICVHTTVFVCVIWDLVRPLAGYPGQC